MPIQYVKDTDGIVTLTLDRADRSANVIDAAFAAMLSETLDRLAAETGLTGVILTSAKKLFLAGADIDSMFSHRDPALYFEGSQALKALFRRLETLGVPVVAAINGSALGGGFELALACHYRIALDRPGIKFGFPEVTLGLLPGGGGIVRAVRLLGLQASFEYLAQGKQVDAQAAQQAGLIHAIATDETDLLAQARAWIAANPKAKQPWDVARFRIPGGDPRSPAVAQMLAIAPAILLKETRGNYPAPKAIMAAAVEGAQVDFSTAERIESRYFASLAAGQVAHNMIGAFWTQLNEIKKGASRPRDVARQTTRKVGVLGAGMMGHGIAYVSAYAGLDVVLKDVTQAQAEAGKARIAALLDKRAARGKLSAEQRSAILDRVQPTATAADLAGCDLIIEAVFEDRALKARVTHETEAVLDQSAVFASNTSTLPITGLARASARPAQFIGLHFFSPVEKMQLVEIIVGAETNEQTLAKAFDYVLQIGKTPIVVSDSRGFYTSRVFATYVNEGLALLGEGQHPRAIESAGMQAGMPVGPLAVSDEVSLSLMAHIRRQTQADLAAEGRSAPDHPANAVLDQMLKHERLGRAAGGGFYDYPADGQKQLWPQLTTLFAANGHAALEQQEMQDRLLFAQAIETVRCLEEGVLRSTADANIGSIFGWGFAPFQGGTLQYINAYGLSAFVARAQELAARYGTRFAPPAGLLARAARSEPY